MQPLLSIVIANYNYGRFLEEAVLSVLHQVDESMRLPTGERIELIIVDGGSTDNSIEIIKKYESKLAWWRSEPDRGQSHAFNKGFSHANGQFLTWLNSDDVFFPGALGRVIQAILHNMECEWFVAGCCWLDPALRVIKCSGARPFSKLRATRGHISVWAPSSFFSKDLFERAGRIDERYHYMMDTELWFRFYREQGVVYYPVKGYCWGLRLHPDAKMSGHNFPTSEHSLSTHPKWQAMKSETKRFVSRYGNFKRLSMVRYLTTPPLIYLRNRYDTWRFKGKQYETCFVREIT